MAGHSRHCSVLIVLVLIVSTSVACAELKGDSVLTKPLETPQNLEVKGDTIWATVDPPQTSPTELKIDTVLTEPLDVPQQLSEKGDTGRHTADSLRTLPKTEGPEAGSSLKSFLQYIFKGLNYIVKNGVSIAVLTLFLLLLVFAGTFIYLEAKRDTVLIEPFEVPKELEEKGYTGRAITNRLIDQLNLIYTMATTATSSLEGRKFRIDLPQTPPQMELAVAGISLKFFPLHIKELFGHVAARLVGEVVVQSDSLYVTTRVSGEPAKTMAGKLENLDKILFKAAKHIYKYTQPYILASYLYDIDRKACLETIQHILRYGPDKDRPWAYNLWGLALDEQKNYDESIDKYQEATELESKFAPAYHNWGDALGNQRKYKKAIAKYKKAIKLDPKSVWVYYSWGLMLAEQGKDKKAIGKFKKVNSKCKKAIKLDPKNAIIYYSSWGVTLALQKDYEGPIAKYEKAIELDPGYAKAYRMWGDVLVLQKDYEGAIFKHEKAIELDPVDAYGYVSWGVALALQEDYEGAIFKYEKAIELDPQNADAYNNWGKVLYRLGRYEEAIAKFKKAIDLDPKCDIAYLSWGEVLRAKGDKNGAIQKSQKVIELDPDGELATDARKAIDELRGESN